MREDWLCTVCGVEFLSCNAGVSVTRLRLESTRSVHHCEEIAVLGTNEVNRSTYELSFFFALVQKTQGTQDLTQPLAYGKQEISKGENTRE